MSAGRVMNVGKDWRERSIQYISSESERRETYGRFLQSDPNLFKQGLVMKYYNLSLRDFKSLCSFTDRDWFNYLTTQNYYKDSAKPQAKGTEDSETVLTYDQFEDWVGKGDQFTYELYLTMNMLASR